MSKKFDFDVVVIGSGPVGLALAGDLGRRGHSCLVVEKTDGVVTQPKMDMVGIRTMEYCRMWGLTEDVHKAGYNRSYPQDNVFLTSLTGFEVGRQPMPSMVDEPLPPESPTHRERCPQNFFDPVLLKFAKSQKGVSIRYNTEYVKHQQDDEGIVVEVMGNGANASEKITARYLVGCDGANSVVRKNLGIEMHGQGILTYTTNVIFETKNLNALHNKKPGYRYMFVGDKGAWGTLVAIDGYDKWRMSIIGDKNPQPKFTDHELKEFAYRMMGKEFDLQILSVLPWIRAELVADKYSVGRVFLCGDACHRTSPTAGLGMNTGIGDAVDLSWKLSACIQGWGGLALLDSYGKERLPIAERFTRFSTGNLNTMKSAPGNERINEDSDAGRETRRQVGRYLEDGLRREWFSLNMHLGNRYTDSNVIVYNEVESPEEIEREYLEPSIYIQSTRPGARAPHAWLRDGRSTLDLFGNGFVCVVFSEADEQAARKIVEPAAKAQSVPMQVVRLTEPEIANIYDRRFVIVRPDGHVGWRDEKLPSDFSPIITTLIGIH